MLAPIALFVYNRPNHLRQTLISLEQNELASDSELYIFADGPKSELGNDVLIRIAEVRKIIRENWGFKSVYIIEKDINNGLANSVISGVTDLVNQYGKVIVLEDDLLTARGFLKYTNDALDFYANEPKVMQICGYQFPAKFRDNTPETFFLPLTTSWGWATWKRAWDLFDPIASGWEELKTNHKLKKKFDLDGIYPYANMLLAQMEYKSIDSWAIRWWWSVFKNEGLVLYKSKSFIENIGFDNFATHTNSINFFSNKKLNQSFKTIFPSKIDISKNELKVIKLFLKKVNDVPQKKSWLLIYLKSSFDYFLNKARIRNKSN